VTVLENRLYFHTGPDFRTRFFCSPAGFQRRYAAENLSGGASKRCSYFEYFCKFILRVLCPVVTGNGEAVHRGVTAIVKYAGKHCDVKNADKSS